MGKIYEQLIKGDLEYDCIKVLRGKNKIGGTVVQITGNGKKIWIDFGMELSVSSDKSTDNALVKLMQNEETRPDAVFFTHIHGDHIGLLSKIPDDMTIFIGKVGKMMKDNIANAMLKLPKLKKEDKERIEKEKSLLNRKKLTRFYKDGEQDEFEGIKFTAMRVDHSVFDSYMLKFEIDGKVIVHTGDYRGHGRLGKALIPNVKKFAKGGVDILLTEGTMMSRSSEKVMTEEEMCERAKKILKMNKYAFLICSSTNLDSLASFYRAAVSTENKRALYCSNYIKSQLDLFTKEIGEKENLWEYKFYRSYVIDKKQEYVLPTGELQFDYMKDNGFLLMVNQYDGKLMEEYNDLNPILIYSMWSGYLDEKKPYANQNLVALKKAWGKKFIQLHTSGHATPDVITEVIKAIEPKEAIIPIHTEHAGGFYELDIEEKRKKLLKLGLPEDFDFKFAPDNDSRAFSDKKYPDVMKALEPGGSLHAFVELVKFVEKDKTKDKLEMCFRANSGRCCTLYYNNNEFFKISLVSGKPRLTMNMEHSRYYSKSIRTIVKEFNEAISESDKMCKFRWHYTSRDNTITKNAIECDGHKFTLDELKKVYYIRREIMESYFSLDELKDYYSNEKLKEYFGTDIIETEYPEYYIDEVKTVAKRNKLKLEKKEQQRIMTANTNCKDGYYVYDMEFSQPFENEDKKDIYKYLIGNKKQNKPDLLAIRFEGGIPKALVFVELKSTKDAMKGRSGAIKHMKGMRTYVDSCFNKNFIENRKNEAFEIMSCYKKLGIHNCDAELNDNDFKELDIELLLVITDHVPDDVNDTEDKNGKVVESAYQYYKENRKIIDETANQTKCDILLLTDKEDFVLRKPNTL